MNLSDDARYYAAAAYQSERVRRAANNLAGWTVAYLKNRGRERAESHAAYQFAEAVSTLASLLVWNETEADHHGPMARDAAGIALALDLVHKIPAALDAAYRFSDGSLDGMAQSDCVELAKQHATAGLARACLEVCRLVPGRFSGPDGEARFKASREIWRDLHGVQSEPPATLDEVLCSALIIPPLPTTGQQKPTTEAPAAPEGIADTAGGPGPAARPKAIATTPEGIADTLERNRKPTPARLVRHMAARESAAFQDIATAVHDDKEIEDSTIRSNVNRTNTELEALAAPFRFKCSGSKVYKETRPVA